MKCSSSSFSLRYIFFGIILNPPSHMVFVGMASTEQHQEYSTRYSLRILSCLRYDRMLFCSYFRNECRPAILSLPYLVEVKLYLHPSNIIDSYYAYLFLLDSEWRAIGKIEFVNCLLKSKVILIIHPYMSIANRTN